MGQRRAAEKEKRAEQSITATKWHFLHGKIQLFNILTHRHYIINTSEPFLLASGLAFLFFFYIICRHQVLYQGPSSSCTLLVHALMCCCQLKFHYSALNSMSNDTENPHFSAARHIRAAGVLCTGHSIKRGCTSFSFFIEDEHASLHEKLQWHGKKKIKASRRSWV